jgi:hypothetical protein
MTRRPPLVASPDLVTRGDLTFGFATQSEVEGWTVTAYGADGRQLGRPLKGLSQSAQLTLTRPPTEAANASELQRLADAWTHACKHSSTNADVLTAFADAAGLMRAGASPDEPT